MNNLYHVYTYNKYLGKYGELQLRMTFKTRHQAVKQVNVDFFDGKTSHIKELSAKDTPPEIWNGR